MPSVGIVIVNFRTPALVIDCLHSLAHQVADEPDWRVLLLDNGSGDDSVARFEEARRAHRWEAWLDVVDYRDNRGFAAGNNAALRRLLAEETPADLFLLLNPDTIVRPGAIRALVEFMQVNPAVGIAGSRLEERDGTPQVSAFRFPSLLGEWENGLRLGLMSWLLARWVVAPPVRDETHAADWLSGASMMVRRDVFDTIGLLDETYFLYFEETDFCLRAHRAGWSCAYVPESRVVHLVGQSTGINAARRRIPRYWLASRWHYFRKNHGVMYAHASSFAWAAGHAVWRLRRRLQRKPDRDPPWLLWDFVRFNFVPAR
jgi:GT2 family glycosyltransferase